jgi:hypothetical protein
MRRIAALTVAAVAALLVACGWAAPARAHLTPNSETSLDFGQSLAIAEIVVPMGELGYALDRPTLARPGPARQAALPQLGAYLMGHMRATAPDGRPWSLKLRDIAVVDDGSGPDLKAHVEMRPPAGASVRVFDLSYSAVIERVRNHFVLVMSRMDFEAGRLSDRPRMIGGLQSGAARLRVDRGPGSAWRGFASAVRLGMRHIAEGHDHLLFLMALLLPAPLLAQGRRWGGFGGLTFTARRLTGVVSAFTVGHSATLLGGAFLGWRLPTQPVEVMIAVSILVSSIHAWRPLFAGREPWVAGGFGLVHGLAFATLIGRFGLEPLQKAQSILGFNVGIELVQLAVVAAVIPALVLLAQTRTYPALRTAGAAFTGVAALAWIAERAGGADNPVGRLIDAGLNYAPWLLAVLTIGAVAATLAERRRRGAAS